MHQNRTSPFASEFLQQTSQDGAGTGNRNRKPEPGIPDETGTVLSLQTVQKHRGTPFSRGTVRAENRNRSNRSVCDPDKQNRIIGRNFRSPEHFSPLSPQRKLPFASDSDRREHRASWVLKKSHFFLGRGGGSKNCRGNRRGSRDFGA